MGQERSLTRIFVYGTLHPAHQPEHVRRWAPPMVSVGVATVNGRLYDLGSFPGLVLEDGGGLVHGAVFSIADDPEVWRLFDRYEGFMPQRPAESLFRRERCLATFDQGLEIDCWTYVYNRSVHDAPLVPEGRWKGIAVL